MPNTFVHLGVQTLASRAVLKTADFKWIAVGCIIPDLPWIMQRISAFLNIGINSYVLRNYLSVQASFVFCLVLCGAFALAAFEKRKIFVLLGSNSLLHLLLDAVQIKWANGVHLFAPFSWKLTSFNLIWPENSIIFLLTCIGAIVLVCYGYLDRKKIVYLTSSRSSYTAAMVLILVYLVGPGFFISQMLHSDNHYSATLSKITERPGKCLELDRGFFRTEDRTVRIYSGERLRISGMMPEHDALVSLRGYCVDTKTIHVTAMHIHSLSRDYSSIIALAGVLFVWLTALINKRVAFSAPTGKT